MSLNKACLLGHLGADPVIRHTQDGKAIANFSMATSERWRDRASGERKEKSEWHRIVIFNEGLAKVAEQYLKKGSQVYIEGKIQTRKYADKDGVEKYSTEITLSNFDAKLVMLGGPADRDDDDAPASPTARSNGGARTNFTRDLDDEVPF